MQQRREDPSRLRFQTLTIPTKVHICIDPVAALVICSRLASANSLHQSFLARS